MSTLSDATRAARRLRDEAEREAQGLRDEAEREAQRLRDEAAEAAKREAQRLKEEAEREAQRLKEEAEREAQRVREEAEREAQRLRDEAVQEVNEAKNRIQDAINNGANNLKPQDVVKVLEQFQENIPPEITEKGKEYIAKLEEVKNKLQELQEPLDINTIKREILHKAEEFCEAYLKEKLEFLLSINLKGIPKVKLDFNGQEVTAKINIFIIPNDLEESEYERQWMVSLNVNITQEVTKVEAPTFILNIRPNPDWTQDRFEEIRQHIENKKDELIAQLIVSILQDYLPPLRALNEAINLFK